MRATPADPVAQSSPWLITLQVEAGSGFIGNDLGDIAFIDRLAELAVAGAALQPGAAPVRERLMGHVGVDMHATHQPAGEAEAARGGIVVDLVLRRLRGVVGGDAVGVERTS